MPKSQGPRQREHMNEMMAAMARFEWDMHDTVARAGRLPPEWREIWEGRGAPKERVTLRLDRDVVRFFRSMGDGYGPRMNAILRAFMQARLAGLIEHGDLTEKYREDWMGQPRPTEAAHRAEVERTLALAREGTELMRILSENTDPEARAAATRRLEVIGGMLTGGAPT
ncbi:MAG: BrnA antitoxin family protein [Pseudomonadota bacterium]